MASGQTYVMAATNRLRSRTTRALHPASPRVMHRATSAQQKGGYSEQLHWGNDLPILIERNGKGLTWLDVGTEQLGAVLEELHLHV